MASEDDINSLNLNGLPLPDDIISDNIFNFVGKDSYVGFGAVNKRFNRLYKTHCQTKKSSFAGYAKLAAITKDLEKRNISMKPREILMPDECEHIVTGIVSFRRMDLLDWVVRTKNHFLYRYLCLQAVEDGRLIFMKKIFEIMDKDSLLYFQENAFITASAVEKGDLECLKFLHQKGCEWIYMTAILAVEKGHVKCLKYLHQNGCEMIDNLCQIAASHGTVDCLKYLRENMSIPCDIQVPNSAAKNGHLECLRYLRENGCECNVETCKFAAHYGQLNCLKYLHESGCEWNSDCCAAAVSGAVRDRNLDCLRYMREEGLKWRFYRKYLNS